MNKIETAHEMYRQGKYAEALSHYTDALSVPRTKQQEIALHSNRAACYLRLHDFSKAAEECTAVLELDHEHKGALMLRAQTLVTLKDYHSALFDVNRLIELNPSSEVYRNLQARLKMQLSLAAIPEDEEEMSEDETDQPAAPSKSDGEMAGGSKLKGSSSSLSPCLDYSRWENVDDDDDDEEADDDDDDEPQYKFRVKTVGVRTFK